MKMRRNFYAVSGILNISYVVVLIITQSAVGTPLYSDSSSPKNIFFSAGRHTQFLEKHKCFSMKQERKNNDIDAELSTLKDNSLMKNWSSSEGLSRRGGSASHTYPYGIGIIEKLRIALAGGIAGATGTALLYPIDTAKTLRQADPVRYSSVPGALKDLVLGVAGEGNSMGLRKAYSGVISASLFSIPSSALYFGAYEGCKQALTNRFNRYNSRHDASSTSNTTPIPTSKQRLFIHAMSAFSGNTLSSFIFVPKEYIKQQMQAYGSGAMTVGGGQHWVHNRKHLILENFDASRAGKRLYSIRNVIQNTMREKGIKGFYSGYKTTLLRNVPSAILRFAIYEELKLKWLGQDEKAYAGGGVSPVFFISGALAGAMASGMMTPMDVIKTRLATNTIPPNMSLIGNVKWILQENGMHGLYAGFRARMVWSGAFSAIGFGTFEAAKKVLGVNKYNEPLQIQSIETKK